MYMYVYILIAVSFFKVILYKLYNLIVTVFKGQFPTGTRHKATTIKTV